MSGTALSDVHTGPAPGGAGPRDLSRLGRQASATTIPVPPSRWGTRVLLPGAILVGVSALFLTSARDWIVPAMEIKVVPVVAKRAAVGASSTPAFQAAGWVEPAPYPIAVPALADGVVREVLVLEGQSVTAGDVLVRLVDEDAKIVLIRAQAELAMREAEALTAKAAVEAAQRSWDHPVARVGALQAAQAARAEIEAELAHLAKTVEVARAKLAISADQLERQRQARSRSVDAVSEAELERARLNHAVAQAELDATVARRPVLEAQGTKAASDVTAATHALELRIAETLELAQAQSGLARARAAVEVAKAGVAQAALCLERMEIRALVDGIILRREVAPGSRLGATHAAHVAYLYQPGKLQVRIDVPLADAAKVVVGGRVKVVVEVLPDREFAGTVKRISPEADIQKNTVQVKVALDSPDPALTPEMLARATFLAVELPAGPTSEESEMLFAPAQYLGKDAAGEFAWVVASDRIERRSIARGTAAQQGWVEVRSGLVAGDRIAAMPPDSLQAGLRVKVVGEASTTEGAR